MIARPRQSTRTDTLFPYTTLIRSFQLPDGRIFFAIPYERDFRLTGTTDADHEGPLDASHASAEEIEYRCEGANQYFRTAINPADVLWTYSGVRPLVEDGSGKPEAATRGYRIDLDCDEGAPLLTIYGGKITSYRHVAQHAVDELAAHVAALTRSEEHTSEPQSLMRISYAVFCLKK